MSAAIISLNGVNQLIFVMVKCSVFFAVRTEFLNIIWMIFGYVLPPPVKSSAYRYSPHVLFSLSFGFKGLSRY
jgi:hypothetical protein